MTAYRKASLSLVLLHDLLNSFTNIALQTVIQGSSQTFSNLDTLF